MFKKLDDLSSLLKQFKASIKMPKMQGVKPIKMDAAKLPGLPQASKKDPVKVAQQIENADIKPIAVKAAKQKKESLKIAKSGQWSLSNHQEDADGSLEKASSTHHVATLSDKSTIHYKGDKDGYHHYEVHSPEHGKYKVSLGHPGGSKVWGPGTKPEKSFATPHESEMGRAVSNHVNKMHGKPETPKRTKDETIDTTEKSEVNRMAYKMSHAATADGNSSYNVHHAGEHIGTLSISHKDHKLSGQLKPSHEGHRDYLNHAVKAFHIARNTKTDN